MSGNNLLKSETLGIMFLFTSIKGSFSREKKRQKCIKTQNKNNKTKHKEGQYHTKYSESINKNIFQCYMNNLKLTYTQNKSAGQMRW